MNGGMSNTYIDPRVRDSDERVDFRKFLTEIVRNSLTYDGIALWTQTDSKKRIVSYVPLPAQNIRLLAKPKQNEKNYVDVRQATIDWTGHNSKLDADEKNDPNSRPPGSFACAVDDANNVIQWFTRNDLIWYTRNSRVDVEVGGYGFPEIEMSILLITGLTNAFQFNADLFDKNSIPKGMLVVKGPWTQRQFDAIGRTWQNLQRGPRTDWTLPALQLTEKGSIELINLEPLRGQHAYYNLLVNLFIGALAAMYRFPAHKLGFKISGTERDPKPDLPKQMIDTDDIGLTILLTHIENLINSYLISPRWPNLKFVFNAKSPREDERWYEARMLSATWDEKRGLVGLPPISTTVKDKENKKIAELMGMCPTDPALVGAFQSLIAAQKGQEGAGETPGSRFESKIDPAKSEDHGHMSGVRRDSRKEKGKDEPTSRRMRSNPDSGSTYTRVDET
jgi:hypothetical protein